MPPSAPTPLTRAVEHVFGVSAPALSHAAHLQRASLRRRRASWNRDQSSSAHYPKRYLGREDVFELALAHDPAVGLLGDPYGLLTNTLLVSVPFRGESMHVEVDAPHRLWLAGDGPLREVESPFGGESSDATAGRFRHRRASWLLPLLPAHADFATDPVTRRDRADDRDQLARWAQRAQERDVGLDREALHDESERRGPGSADALGVLLAAFFLRESEVLVEVHRDAVDSPSAAVRSASRCVIRAASGQDGRIEAHLRVMRDALHDR